MSGSVDIERPMGSLGKLYDQVSTYSNNPISEIEKIAQQAFNDGIIDSRRITVLQHRVPLLGYERETLEQVGVRLGIGREYPRRLEHHIYERLQSYLPEEARVSVEESHIEEIVKEPIPQMLNVREVSALLGVHPNTIRRLSNLGIITTYRIGIRRDRRFRKEDIEEYLKSVKNSN